MIWFTSDEHYYHRNIIKYTNRPFSNELIMNEELIKKHNALVNIDDIVVHLGDFSFCNSIKRRDLIEHLNGNHILILGNHDKGDIESAINDGFIFAAYQMSIRIAGYKVLLSHYPYKPSKIKRFFNLMKGTKLKYMERRLDNKGYWLLHGHVHSKTALQDKSIDIGVDANKYKPVNIRQIARIIRDYYKRKDKII